MHNQPRWYTHNCFSSGWSVKIAAHDPPETNEDKKTDVFLFSRQISEKNIMSESLHQFGKMDSFQSYLGPSFIVELLKPLPSEVAEHLASSPFLKGPQSPPWAAVALPCR